MTEPHPVGRLAAVVVAVQDRQRGQSSATHSQRRARFIDAVTRPPRARRWPWVGVAVAAAAAAALVLAILVVRPAAELEFTVDASPGAAGQWIAATERRVDVAFSDGSSMAILAGSKARVEPGEAGARVVLEAGSVQLEVETSPDSGWRVDAGPFAVRVTGTRFGVDWDPATGELRVDVTEGTVAVGGPVWSAQQHITAGQAIRATVPVEVERTRQAAQEPEPEPELATADETGTPSRPVKPRPRAAKAGPSWPELAARGEHRAAVRAAEAAGFDGLCASAGAADLLKLGDSARYARKAGRATQALEAVRKRFPGTRQADVAAYSLGLVQFDQQRAFAKAARSFSAYLDARPRGGLAREAMGRLMESHQRAGHRDEARAVARKYAARYPKGAHADLAKQLLMP